MSDAIVAEAVRVETIFSDAYRLVLPFFQRGYAWRPSHALRLLADVLGLADGLGDLDWYPLGALIVAKKAGAPEAWVADGHQRLITLTILLAILRDLEADAAVKARLEACITRAEAGRGFRITTLEAAQECLRAYVQLPGGTARDFAGELEEQPDSVVNIIENRDAMRRELRRSDADERRRLTAALLERTIVLVTSVADQRIARLLFETMHDTGLKPTTIDLLKAQVLGRLAPQHLARCRAIWERTEARLGNDGFEALLRHIAVLEQGALLRKPVHTVLQTRFDLDEAEGARTFIDRRLDLYGSHLVAVLAAATRPDTFPPAMSRRLQYLGWIRNHDTWAMPLLRWLERRGAGHADTMEFLARLERFAWVETITAEEPVFRDRRYLKIAAEVREGRALEPDGTLAIQPEARRAVRRVLTVPRFTRRWRIFLLHRINAALEGDDAVTPLPDATIEHVYPRNPEPGSAWRADFRGGREADRFLDLLGNLTLLTEAEQSRTRNLEFGAKQPILAQSPFLLSRQLADRTSWRPDDVGRRTDEMVDILMRGLGLE